MSEDNTDEVETTIEVIEDEKPKPKVKAKKAKAAPVEETIEVVEDEKPKPKPKAKKPKAAPVEENRELWLVELTSDLSGRSPALKVKNNGETALFPIDVPVICEHRFMLTAADAYMEGFKVEQNPRTGKREKVFRGRRYTFSKEKLESKYQVVGGMKLYMNDNPEAKSAVDFYKFVEAR